MKLERGSIVIIARGAPYHITRSGTKWLVVGMVSKSHVKVCPIPSQRDFLKYLDRHFFGLQIRSDIRNFDLELQYCLPITNAHLTKELSKELQL